MPNISYFYGIFIRIYFREHPPPHFHALYGEYVAQIDIATGKVIEGELPRRALALVRRWRKLHIEELMEDWQLAQERKRPKKIEPLE
jgi:Domain of unknown function (DUF4160)